MYNLIFSITKMFLGISNYQNVFGKLGNNFTPIINPNSFQKLKKLKELDLRNNELQPESL